MKKINENSSLEKIDTNFTQLFAMEKLQEFFSDPIDKDL